MICVYWHNSEYTFSMQCLNMKSMVEGFIYRHVSRSVNLITFTSRIFMISITKSWTDNDEGAIDCTNRSISSRLSMKACHIARGKIMLLPWLSPITISTKDTQRFRHPGIVNCRSQCKSSSQYTRCIVI